MSQERNVPRAVPEAGELWRHWKGRTYRILGLVRMEPEGAEGDLHVAYVGHTLEDPKMPPIGWVRHIDDFMGVGVESAGARGSLPYFVHRFIKVKDAPK